MSGHSKWATIKRKKASTDAARGKVFTKLIKEITISARDGGGDPVGNPRLRLAIQSAKSSNMPQDNITRAIKKGTGELEGVKYEEITYEAYAPHGIAVMIQCVTDNRNRTVAELRHMISKHNGNLGDSGSVAWMFERKGVVTIEKGNHTEDDVMEIILDAGADDLKTEEEFFEVITSMENLEKVRKALDEKKYKIESASLQYIAKDLVALDEAKGADLMKFLDIIEEYDDVQNLFTNADF
ncbi:MAG: YebC/PmpR family DNA-binding transcriptional regulator [Ignavibacteriae bacterium]|nr:YebC/PmpR family DNA-binding transcriptional regulator [Ignavibacteriota bacterium]